MPTFTVLNDIHLKPSYEGVVEAVTLPPETDAVIIAGDLLDRSDPASVERGRQLLSRLDDSPVPTALVPGNHDPLATAEALVDGFDSVVLAHERRLTAADVPGPADAFDQVPVVGIGCEQFDAGVEVEYDAATGLSVRDDYGHVDRYEEQKAVRQLLTGVDTLLAGETTPEALRSTFGFPRTAIDGFQRTLDRGTLLTDLLSVDQPVLLVSHVPPFGTDLDIHHSSETRRNDGLHLGWLALAGAIRRGTPSVAVAGHSHVQGYATYDGHPTHLINGGFRGVTTVEVESDGFGFRFLDPDWLPGQ